METTEVPIYFKRFTVGDLIVAATALIGLGISWGGIVWATSAGAKVDEELRREIAEARAVPITHGAAAELAAVKVQIANNAEINREIKESIIRLEDRVEAIQEQNVKILLELRR